MEYRNEPGLTVQDLQDLTYHFETAVDHATLVACSANVDTLKAYLQTESSSMALGLIEHCYISMHVADVFNFLND